MITKKGTYGLLGSAKTISQGRARGRGRSIVDGKRVGPAHSTSALGFGAESSDDDEVTEDPLSRAAVNRRLAAEQKMREGQVVGAMIYWDVIYVCVCVEYYMELW